MKIRTKKAFAWLMTFAMLLSLLPSAGLTALAAEGDAVSYRYPVYKKTTGTPYEQASSGIAEWKDGSVANYTLVSSADTEWTDGWYVVTGAIEIQNSVTCTGDVNLILTDDSSLTVTSSTASDNFNAGICVSSGNSLTVYGQEQNSGTLTAKCETTGIYSSTYGAGIGSSYGVNYQGIDSGAITINGGTVTAISDTSGAGIGGGKEGRGSNITINGGSVTATSGSGGAGIGGGGDGSGSNITINGGSVTATGGNYGAGIGGGDQGSGSNIKIATTLTVKAGSSANPTTVIENDGNDLATKLTARYATVTPPPSVSYLSPVYKEDGKPASGLKEMETKSCTEFTEVTAEDTEWKSGWYVVNGEISITNSVTCNGDVNLILADGASLTISGVAEKSAGICVSGDGNSLTIYGQANGSGKLEVTGGTYAAGIGGGWGGSGSNITINGGEVTANGGFDGAGIGSGSGRFGIGSNITINGGEVTATGGESGAGIGGGFFGSGSDITINGGTVTATGNGDDTYGYGAGIGNGASCTTSASTIKIATTLTVKADGNNPPTTPITNTGDDLAGDLTGKQYVAVKLQISVTGTKVDNKEYDGTTAATAKLGTVSGIAEGDQVEVTATATFSDANAGEDKNVTVTYTLSGDDAGKYFAPDTETLTANITKAPVEVPTAKSFTYDGDKKTALTIAEDALYELDSTIEGGVITATDAGNYSFYVTLKDANTANYEWDSTTPDQSQQITWSIAKAEVEVPEAVTGLVYDGEEQTGVELPEGALYTLDDNTGTNAKADYKATASLGENAKNYQWKDKNTSDDQTISWSIAQRTVTLWSETASKDYDGSKLTAPTVYADSNKTKVDSVFAGEVTGLAATGSVTYVSQGEVTNEITYTFKEGCSEKNYSITKTEGKLIVTRADTMTITGSDYTGFYDGKAHGDAATPSKDGSTVYYRTSTDNATWSEWSKTVPQITDAGTWYIKAKAENPNYTDAECDYTLTVNQFTGNTITGLTCEKVKKGDTPAPTATATFGEITYSYSKDGETWGDWDSIYDGESGEYQVKAYVKETANYNGCESEPFTFSVGSVCEGWKIVKFDELNPGQYKMYLNNTDTGVYNFAMVVGGYTIQEEATGEYVCLENGKIVKKTTNPTVWAKGIASFHASAVSTGRWGHSTRYYLNVDRDGNLIADRLPGITHFATYVEADEHEYYVHSNFNGTHTHTCIVCGDSYEEDCTPNRWNFCTECGGYFLFSLCLQEKIFNCRNGKFQIPLAKRGQVV